MLKKAGYKVSYDAFEFAYVETIAEKRPCHAPTPRDVADRG